MSSIQKGVKLFKGFIHRHNKSLQKYGIVTEKKVMLSDRIVWMDMEMTGLDTDTCHIIEVACLITDPELNIVSDDFNVVINQPDEILDRMNDWCKVQHGKTGLTEACRNSKISLQKAETDLLNFIQSYVPEKKSPLAGNTIYMDRLFLLKYMPLVDQHLHYRIIDVSSIKELARVWNYKLYREAPQKMLNHRALDDIRESIKELKYYKEHFFKSNVLSLQAQ